MPHDKLLLGQGKVGVTSIKDAMSPKSFVSSSKGKTKQCAQKPTLVSVTLLSGRMGRFVRPYRALRVIPLLQWKHPKCHGHPQQIPPKEDTGD